MRGYGIKLKRLQDYNATQCRIWHHHSQSHLLREFWQNSYRTAWTIPTGETKCLWNSCRIQFRPEKVKNSKDKIRDIVGEWVMKHQPFWIKILHIPPILLGTFGEKKEWLVIKLNIFNFSDQDFVRKADGSGILWLFQEFRYLSIWLCPKSISKRHSVLKRGRGC